MLKGKTRKLTDRAFLSTVAALVIPLAGQNLINVAVQSADVIMLGRLDKTVLSAASLAGQVQFVLTLIFFGVASGASVLTAQYWGKGDTRAIEKIFALALRLSMAAAVLFFLVAVFMPGQVMRIFSPEPKVIEQGTLYLRWVAVSYLFMAFTNTYLTVLRSVEKVVISTVVYFISLLTNIALNAILIFGLFGFPAMGIVGAALATAIARFVEVVITVVYAVKNPVIRLRLKDFLRWPRALLSDFTRYAGPTTLNEMFWGLAISMNSVIIGHMGESAVAANSVAQVVRQLAMVIAFGLASATAVMVGKAIGAGDKARAQDYAGRFLRLTMITGIAGSLLILIIRPFVVAGMDLGPEPDSYLRFLLIIMSVYVVLQCWNTTMVVGIFRGGGDTRFGLLLDTTVMWGGSLVWGALAAFVFKAPVEVVFIILMCDELIKVPITAIRYKSKRWLKDVTRPEADIE